MGIVSYGVVQNQLRKQNELVDFSELGMGPPPAEIFDHVTEEDREKYKEWYALWNKQWKSLDQHIDNENKDQNLQLASTMSKDEMREKIYDTAFLRALRSEFRYFMQTNPYYVNREEFEKLFMRIREIALSENEEFKYLNK